MKQTPLIFLLLSLLTACAAPTSVPAATVSVLPTASPVSGATDVAANTPIPTFKPTPPFVEYNQLAPETTGCLKNDMCLGLEVGDKEAAYLAVVEAFANGYEIKDWMKQMGFDNAEELLAFLRTSTHVDPATGEERAYWIPLTAPGGATFKILQGNGRYSGGIFSDENPAIVAQGGFWLDSVGFVAASKAEIDANTGGVADWLDKMWEQNGEDVLIRMGSRDTELWGMAVVDGQLVFVMVNSDDPLDSFAGRKEALLGHSGGKNDAKIISAAFGLYLEASVDYGNNKLGKEITNGIPALEPDSNKWRRPELCVAGDGCDGNIYDTDPWFVPKDTTIE